MRMLKEDLYDEWQVKNGESDLLEHNIKDIPVECFDPVENGQIGVKNFLFDTQILV